MKRCPITYEIINDDESYSSRGLKLLSPQLKNLKPVAFSAKELRAEAINMAGKMSIQGVQPKLSAVLKTKQECFELVEQGGQFILKPQNEYYAELPENEAITMSMAETIGIEIPVHGLLYSKDNSMTYFIKRFDRRGLNKKVPVEDFAQLSKQKRDTKYQSSMEKVSKIIIDFCSFPKIELVKLFKLTLFNFLIGNEDMHLKNFSLITHEKIVSLSPAYDLVNTDIVMNNSKEEIALALNGKKNNLNRRDFLDYFANQKLQLNQNVIEKVLEEIKNALPVWRKLISDSFLSKGMQNKYLRLLEERAERLDLC